jgi:predicted PurR-regulated permease PerM
MNNVKNRQKIEQIAGWVFIGAIVVGCGFVMRPFVVDILWAAILCFVTWPLYELLLKWCRGRKTLVAALMTIVLLLVLFIPFFVIGLKFTDSVRSAMEWLEAHKQTGLPTAPVWVERIPLAGAKISEYWSALAANEEAVANRLMPWIQKSGLWLLQHSVDLGQGIGHLAISVLISFFMYRAGEGVVAHIREGFQRVSGDQAQHLINVVRKTIRTVVYGAIGTAVVQGVVAGIGFGIAGAPSVMLLALFTFFLSFIPFGPPIIWIGVSLWLFAEERTGWGTFMIIYGLVAISSIDNLIKPYLISRGSRLPFIVMFIGVLGGIATFGLIGVFVGPILLAVGYSLMQEFLSHSRYAFAGKTAVKSQ